MTMLSVIVPCYNCAATLEEAVASIYRQELGIPFEVILIDDGSDDSTYAIMRRLAATYPRVKLLRNPTNQGGGSARNKAVAHSRGHLIFCLDSDDILGADFLKNMVRFWLRKRCDAVGMSTSIKFRGSSTENVAYITEFEGPGTKVRFESFFEGPLCSLSVVFMMTRAAFMRVGGYPTHHGFDTQGMAFRFLCSGLTAYTCPETRYFHRVDVPTSYYLREYAAGMINWNWFSVLDEHIYVFADAVKAKILASDLFAVPGKPEPPPLRSLVTGRRRIFAPNYRLLIRLGPRGVARRFQRSQNMFDQYWLGGYHLSRGSYRSAMRHFEEALSRGFDYRIIYLKMLLASLRLSGRAISGPQGLKMLALYSGPFPPALLPLRQRVFRGLVRLPLVRAPVQWLKTQWDLARRQVFR
jgi:glycosyltransferase involved in cell wall biosynthesis